MKKITFLFFLALSCNLIAEAQFSRHIVRLKNKGGGSQTLTNPLPYLSQRAIDRRNRYSITLDSTDLPVSSTYLTQIRNIPGITVLNVSKWLNAVSIQTTDPNVLAAVSALPFVQSVEGLSDKQSVQAAREKFASEAIVQPLLPSTSRIEDIQANYFNYGTNSFNEIHLHNGEFLHNIGLRGQNMQIAVLDAGFLNYNTLDALDSININGQVLSTWDFVARHSSVAEDHSHGMQCLSTIAANIPGQFIGKAPKASFHLFRTEDAATEYPVELFNWVCGAERADSTGSDIISSSLGYFDFDNPVFDYTYADMDGNTTIAVIGADLAAKKGIIVFNSIGNEGSSAWHFLATPSDGDSVVAVGAVSTSGNVGGFSGYGPSSDGRIKPDMSSVGVAAMIQTTANTVGTGNGTSFACPNMAGLGTCLWQGFPEYNNMRIVRALREAGHKFNNPDDRVGYGIPDMRKAFASLVGEYATSSATANECRVTISWTSKDVQTMKYEIERKGPGNTNYSKVGELSPKPGVSLGINSYTFNNDLTAGSFGLFSYRIRQVLDTSSAGFFATYIDTASVTITNACVVTSLPDPNAIPKTVYVQPNPVSGSTVTLVIETPEAIPSMPISLYDEKGSLLRQWTDAKTSGKKMIEVPVSRLAAGKYIFKVQDGQKTVGTAVLVKL